MTTNEYVERARAHATSWKDHCMPELAGTAAPYMTAHGPRGRYQHCLPPARAAENLLPAVRDEALGYFTAHEIRWQASVEGGPSNHLLSSQVQCVNALAPMVRDPERIVRAFGAVLDVAEPLEIEPARLVAFEHIGAVDHLGEVPRGPRRRGAMTTSADAAIRYRTSTGIIEIALIEWKYTEDCRATELEPSRFDRLSRYRPLVDRDDCPIRFDAIPYEDVFVEPFYQLFRQQLLAHEMERARELDADRVRVVHVSPVGNVALRTALHRDSHRRAGGDVFDIWRSMLCSPDRFVCLDSALFCDRHVTSDAYVARYGHD